MRIAAVNATLVCPDCRVPLPPPDGTLSATCIVCQKPCTMRTLEDRLRNLERVINAERIAEQVSRIIGRRLATALRLERSTCGPSR